MNTLDKQKTFLYNQSAGKFNEPSKQENLLKFAKNNLIVSPLVPYKYEDKKEAIITPTQSMTYNQLDSILPQYLSQSKLGTVDNDIEDLVDIGLGLINNVTPDVARMNRDMYINQFFGRDVDNQGFLSAMWDGMKSYGEQKKLAKLVNQFDSTKDGDYKDFLKSKIDSLKIDMDKNQDFTTRDFISDLFVKSAPVIAQSAESLILSTILGYFGGKLATMFGSAVDANNYISAVKYIDNAKKASYFKGYLKRKARKAGEAWANPVGYFTASGKQLGAKLGTAINTAANTYQVERGLASYEMYQQGITNDKIRNQFADTVGLVNSFIEVVTVDPFKGREQLGKKLRKFSLYDILNYGNKTGAFTKGAVDFAFDSAVSTFEESLEEGLQGATEEYFTEIAKELNDNKKANVFSGDKLMKAYEKFNSSFVEALGPSAVLGLIGASFSSITSTVGDTVSANKFFKNAKNSKVIDIDNVNIDATSDADINAMHMYIKNMGEKESTKNIDDKKARKKEEKTVKQEQLLDPIRVYQERDGSFTPISPKDNVTALLANFNNASGVRVIVHEHSNFRPAKKTGLSTSNARTAPRKMMESMITDMGFEKKGDVFVAKEETASDEGFRNALNKLDEYAVQDIFTMPYGGQVYTFKDSAGLPYRIYVAQNDSMWAEEREMVQDTLQRTKDYYTKAVDDIKMVSTSDELDNYTYEDKKTYGYVVNEATTAEELIHNVSDAVANAYNNKKTNPTKIDNAKFTEDVTTFIKTGKFDSKNKSYDKVVRESAQKIYGVLFSNMYTLEDALDYFEGYNSEFKEDIEKERARHKNAIFKEEGYENVSDAVWEQRSIELRNDREAIKEYIKKDADGIFNNEGNESISDAMAIFVQMVASNAGMTGEKWLKTHGFEFRKEADNGKYAGTTDVDRSKKGNISRILIRATTSADLSTFEHEMIHAIFAINDGNIKEQFKEIFDRIKDDANFKLYLKEHKKIFRDPRFQNESFSYDKLFEKWGDMEDEFVAYLYESYRADDRYNDKKLNTFFKRVKNFFKMLVHALHPTVKLNDEVVNFYEGLFNTDILNYSLYKTKREMMQGLTDSYNGMAEDARRANSASLKLGKIASRVQKALKTGSLNDVVSSYASLIANLSDAEDYSYITDTLNSDTAEKEVTDLLKAIVNAKNNTPEIVSNFVNDKIKEIGKTADEGYINTFINDFADSLRKDNIISYEVQSEIQKAYPLKEQSIIEDELKSEGMFQTMSDKIAVNWLKDGDTSISSFVENAFMTYKSPEMREIEEEAKEDGTFMLAPNGEKTKLNEYQWLQVRTERFKKWFGDWENHPNSRYTSKMLDENGEPKVFYHGTSNVFEKFRVGGKDRAFFSDDMRIASSYGGPTLLNIDEAMKADVVDEAHVIPCFLKITAPDVVEGHNNSWKNLTGASDVTIYAVETDEDLESFNSIEDRDKYIDELKSKGIEYKTYEDVETPDTVSTDSYIDKKLDKENHDGVVFNNIIDLDNTEHSDAEYTSTVVAVTSNSNQIKHAMQNDGSFSVSGNMLAQTAFHGTPYIIDFFDSKKIGTGEGAQAYGWGLYFSQKYGVAEDYAYDITESKNNLKKQEQISELNERLNEINEKYEDWMHFFNFYKTLISNNRLPNDLDSVRYGLQDILSYDYVPDDFKKRLAPFDSAIESASNLKEEEDYFIAHQTEYNNIIDEIEMTLSDRFEESKIKVAEWEKEARPYINELDRIYKNINSIKNYEPNLYTVELPDDTEENYIDWYGAVPKRIYDILRNEFPDNEDEEIFDTSYEFGEFYRYFADFLFDNVNDNEAGDKQASEWLNKHGYTGIKQQIGSGRAGFRGNKNYDGNFNLIIFDDNDIQIKNRKNLLTNEITEYEQKLYQMVFSDGETPALTSEDADRAKQFMDRMDDMSLKFENNDFTGYKSTNRYENQIINGLSRVQKYLSNANDIQIDDVISIIDTLDKEYQRLVGRDIFYNAKNKKDDVESRELAKQASSTLNDVKLVLMVASGKRKHGTLSDNRTINEELINYESLRDYIYDKNRQKEYFEYLKDASKRGDRESFRTRMDNARVSANKEMNDVDNRTEAINEFEKLAPAFIDKAKFMARHMLEDSIAEFSSKVSINALVQGLLLGYITTDKKSTLQAIVEVNDKLEEMDNRLADWEEPLFNFEKAWTNQSKSGLKITKSQFNKIKANLHTLSEMNRKQIATFLSNSLGIDLGTTPVFSEYYELLGMFNTNMDRKAMVGKIIKATDGSLLSQYILEAYGTDNAVEAYDKFYDDLKASHKKYHDIMADKSRYDEYFKKVFGERAESEFAKKPYIKSQQDKISEVFYELSLNRNKSYTEKMAIIKRKIKDLKIRKTGKGTDLNESLALTIWQMFSDMDEDITERIYLDSARRELFRQFKGNVSPEYSVKHFIERIYDIAHSYPLGQGHMQYYDRLYKIADVLGHIDSMIKDHDYKDKARDEIFAHNLPSRIRRGIIKKISQNVNTLSEFYDLVNTIRRPVREVSVGDATTKMVDHLKSVIAGIDFADEGNLKELNTSDIEVILRDLNYVFNKLGSKEFVEKSTASALVAGDANEIIEYLKYYKQKKEDEAHRANDITLIKLKIENLIKEVEELGRVYDAKVDYVTREYNKQYYKGNMNEIFNGIKALKKNNNPSVEDIGRIRELMYSSQKAVFTTLLRSLDETMSATDDSLKKLGLDEVDAQMMRYYLAMPEADVEAIDKIFLTEEERNKDTAYFKSDRDITTTADIISTIREATNLYNDEKLQKLAMDRDSKQRAYNAEKQKNRDLNTKLRIFRNATSKIASERNWALDTLKKVKDKLVFTEDELKVANWMIGQYAKEYANLEDINKTLQDVIASLEEGIALQADVIKQTEDDMKKAQNAYKSELDKVASEKTKEINQKLSERLKKLLEKTTVNGESAVKGEFIPVLEWIFTTLGFQPESSEIEFYTKAGEILRGKAYEDINNRKSNHKGMRADSLFTGSEEDIIKKIDKPEYAYILDKKIDKSLRRDFSIAKVITMGIPYYKNIKGVKDSYGWSYSQRKMMHELIMEANFDDSYFADIYNGYFTFKDEDAFESEFFNYVRKPNFTYTDQEIASVIMNRHALERTEHGRRVIDDIIHVLIDGKRVNPILKEEFLKPLRRYELVLNEFRQDEYGETVRDENGNPIRKKQKKYYQDIYVERGEDEADVTLRDVLLKDRKTFIQYTAPEKAQLIELINAMAKDSRAEYKAEQDRRELENFKISNNLAMDIAFEKDNTYKSIYGETEEFLKLLSAGTRNDNMLKTHLELVNDDINPLEDTGALDTFWVKRELGNTDNAIYRKALEYLLDFLTTGNDESMEASSVYLRILYQNNFDTISGNIKSESDKERLMKFLKNSRFGFEKPQRLAKRLGATAEDLLIRKAWECQNVETRRINDRMKTFSSKIDSLGFGKGELFSILKEQVKVGNKDMTYTTYQYNDDMEVIGSSTANLTYENMMSIYIYSKSMAGLEKLKSGQGNNYSEESILDVVNFMEDDSNETASKLKELADWMIADFEAEFPELNRISLLVDNVPLERRNGYFPQKSQIGEYSIGKTPKGTIFTKVKVADDMTYLLSDTIYPLNLNAISTYIGGVQAHEHYMAFADYAKNLDSILEKGNIKELVQMKYGNDTLRQLNDYVTRIKQAPISDLSDGERVFMKVLNNVATAKLAGSLTTVTKQLLSAITAWANGKASFFDIMKNLTYFLAHPDDSFIEDTVYKYDPSMIQRTAEYAVKQYSEGRDFLVKSKIGEIRDVMMKPIQFMDKATALAVWKSVYDNVLAETGDVKEASFQAQQVVQETQSTGENLSMASLQTSKKPIIKLAMLFTNDLFQIWNILFSDVPLDIRNKEFGKAVKKLTGVALLGTMMALLSGGWIPDDEDDEFDWKTFLKDMSMEFAEMGIPIAGPEIADLMSGWSRSVFSLPQEIIQMPKNFAKIPERTVEENIEQFYDMFAGGLELTGAPVVGFKRVAKAGYNVIANRDLIDLLYIFGKRWGEGWDD